MDKLYSVVLDDLGAVVSVRRLADNAAIPVNENNKDYQEFLAYQKAGGSAKPDERPPLDQVQSEIEAARLKAIDQGLPVSERFDSLLVYLSIKKPSLSPSPTKAK